MGPVEEQPNSTRMPLRRSRGNRNRMAGALLTAGVIVSAAGCGGSGSKAATGSAPMGSSPSASASASSGSSTPSGSAAASSALSAQAAGAAQDALAAYRAAYADWVSVSATSDYQSALLANHMSGSALSYVTRTIYINKTKGAITKGAPVLNPSVIQAVPATNPTQVVISDCTSDKDWLLYTTDGHLFNATPGGNRKSQALAIETNGVWKIDQLIVQPEGTC